MAVPGSIGHGKAGGGKSYTNDARTNQAPCKPFAGSLLNGFISCEHVDQYPIYCSGDKYSDAPQPRHESPAPSCEELMQAKAV